MNEGKKPKCKEDIIVLTMDGRLEYKISAVRMNKIGTPDSMWGRKLSDVSELGLREPWRIFCEAHTKKKLHLYLRKCCSTM